MNIGNTQPFFLIAGPCQIESEAHALKMATAITRIAAYGWRVARALQRDSHA